MCNITSFWRWKIVENWSPNHCTPLLRRIVIVSITVIIDYNEGPITDRTANCNSVVEDELMQVIQMKGLFSPVMTIRTLKCSFSSPGNLSCTFYILSITISTGYDTNLEHNNYNCAYTLDVNIKTTHEILPLQGKPTFNL